MKNLFFSILLLLLSLNCLAKQNEDLFKVYGDRNEAEGVIIYAREDIENKLNEDNIDYRYLKWRLKHYLDAVKKYKENKGTWIFGRFNFNVIHQAEKVLSYYSEIEKTYRDGYKELKSPVHQLEEIVLAQRKTANKHIEASPNLSNLNDIFRKMLTQHMEYINEIEAYGIFNDELCSPDEKKILLAMIDVVVDLQIALSRVRYKMMSGIIESCDRTELSQLLEETKDISNSLEIVLLDSSKKVFDGLSNKLLRQINSNKSYRNSKQLILQVEELRNIFNGNLEILTAKIKALTGQTLTKEILHQMGKTMGLQHNFKGASSPSVMEYVPGKE